MATSPPLRKTGACMPWLSLTLETNSTTGEACTTYCTPPSLLVTRCAKPDGSVQPKFAASQLTSVIDHDVRHRKPYWSGSPSFSHLAGRKQDRRVRVQVSSSAIAVFGHWAKLAPTVLLGKRVLTAQVLEHARTDASGALLLLLARHVEYRGAQRVQACRILGAAG